MGELQDHSVSFPFDRTNVKGSRRFYSISFFFFFHVKTIIKDVQTYFTRLIALDEFFLSEHNFALTLTPNIFVCCCCCCFCCCISLLHKLWMLFQVEKQRVIYLFPALAREVPKCLKSREMVWLQLLRPTSHTTIKSFSIFEHYDIFQILVAFQFAEYSSMISY